MPVERPPKRPAKNTAAFVATAPSVPECNTVYHSLANGSSSSDDSDEARTRSRARPVADQISNAGEGGSASGAAPSQAIQSTEDASVAFQRASAQAVSSMGYDDVHAPNTEDPAKEFRRMSAQFVSTMGYDEVEGNENKDLPSAVGKAIGTPGKVPSTPPSSNRGVKSPTQERAVMVSKSKSISPPPGAAVWNKLQSIFVRDRSPSLGGVRPWK